MSTTTVPVRPAHVLRTGATLAFRELDASDTEALSEILGDPGVMRHMVSGALPPEAVADLVREAEADRSDAAVRTRYRLAVVRREDSLLAGTVTVERDRYSAVYVHSLVLRPGLADFTAGYEACRLVQGFAFEQLGVRRVWCVAMEGNAVAHRLFLVCGCTADGRLRELYFREGRWWDATVYTILAPEWRRRAHLGLREALVELRSRGRG